MKNSPPTKKAHATFFDFVDFSYSATVHVFFNDLAHKPIFAPDRCLKVY